MTYVANLVHRFRIYHPILKLPSRETEAVQVAKETRKAVFHRVAENLYRLETSGWYYALLKRGDKQFRPSLQTTDRKLADGG
jgi:hypothetical protein